MSVAGNIRLDDALRTAAQRLRTVSDDPNLDAQILLAHSLGRDRSWLLAHPEARIDEREIERFGVLVGRVADGEALPYVTGERWFYGRLFSVEPAVLIPRPETELLIECALEFLQEDPSRRVVDVGTGSGCIAVTLCAEIKGLELLAIDRSHRAVNVARRNAKSHEVEQRIDFLIGDLLSAVVGPYDLICANLPYIPRQRLSSLKVVKREPLCALDGGERGLEIIRRLLSSIGGQLVAGGRMILEIDASQTSDLMEWIGQSCPGCRVSVQQDLAGFDRVMIVDKEH